MFRWFKEIKIKIVLAFFLKVLDKLFLLVRWRHRDSDNLYRTCQIDENILKNETNTSILISFEIFRPDGQVLAQLTQKNKTTICSRTWCAAKITIFCQIVMVLLIVQKLEIQGKQERSKTKWRKIKQKSKNLNDKTDSSKKYVMGKFCRGSGLEWGKAKVCKRECVNMRSHHMSWSLTRKSHWQSWDSRITKTFHENVMMKKYVLRYWNQTDLQKGWRC